MYCNNYTIVVNKHIDCVHVAYLILLYVKFVKVRWWTQIQHAIMYKTKELISQLKWKTECS